MSFGFQNHLASEGPDCTRYHVLVEAGLQPGGGLSFIYKPYRYVPPHRVGFLRRFGLKMGIHFAHFGLESGVVLKGTTECMNEFIVSIPN